MAGGLTQLVAYGAQDIYLTGQPQITFFKSVYRRHTNFAVEAIEQAVNGSTSNFGSRLNFTISRNADLVGRIIIEATLPVTSIVSVVVDSGTLTSMVVNGWMEGVGNYLINNCDVEIGGQKIDTQYGMWMDMWADLSMSDAQSTGYGTMVGKDFNLDPSASNAIYPTVPPYGPCGWPVDIANVGNRLYIPLQFWFCRNPGLAIPLVALQYSEVKINLQLETLANLIFSVCQDLTGLNKDTYVALSTTAANQQFNADPVNVNMPAPLRAYCDYYYLDTTERRKFSQNAHEYLIEQLQYPVQRAQANSGNDTGVTIATRRLNLSNPVKELMWCYPRPGGCNAPMNDFTWYPGSSGDVSSGTRPQDCPCTFPQSGGAPGILGGALGGTSVPAYNYIGAGDASLASGVLLLNGNRAFNQRPGEYFRLVQPYDHHTRNSTANSNYVYNYSFSLRPEEHQPSGTCNFSRIDNAQLEFTLKSVQTGGTALDASVDQTRLISVFATNYNILRIMSGMGGLAYSN